jgi:hypothetical protein
LVIELINVVNIGFNSSDVVVNIVGWLKPANTNNYLNLYRVVQLLVSIVLDQPIPIMIFGIGSQQPIKKISFSYRLNGTGLTGRY